MWRNDNLFYGGILAVVLLLAGAPGAQAGFFSDMKLYFSERASITAHTKNVSVAVKEMYRERKSIAELAQGARTLIQAYQSIKDKKSNIPQLLNIASAINSVVTQYNNLAPKAERLYGNVKPDLEYFSKLKEDGDEDQLMNAGSDKKYQYVVKTLSDNRIGKLAGSAGWGRVWGSIKDDPMNVFRWGKLKDEYQYGKTEATYALKCAQIAFEGASYYEAAKNSIKDLLGIQGEIKSLLGGDLSAILNAGGTLNKIQGAGSSVEVLGVTLEQGVQKMGKRFEELNKVQEAYVNSYRNYQQKYGAAQAASSPGSTSTVSATTRPATTTGTTAPSGTTIDLNKAMAAYQTAYQAYSDLAGNPNADPQQVQAAVQKLQQTRALVEQAKVGTR